MCQIVQNAGLDQTKHKQDCIAITGDFAIRMSRDCTIFSETNDNGLLLKTNFDVSCLIWKSHKGAQFCC